MATAVDPDMAALAVRIRAERRQRRMTLQALAGRAEVSSSMLSEVERGAKVPTVLVLQRIANALGISVSRLLGEERAAPVALLRRDEQDVAHDPSGWERRILSPVLPGVEFELMRTTIPPGVDAGTFPPHPPGTREYLAVECGQLRLTIDGEPYDLQEGDAIYYAGECVHRFENRRADPCVYYLAMDVGPAPGARSHR
jgi:XRE family transcriptional regulator, regulator of sulfur utilization